MARELAATLYVPDGSGGVVTFGKGTKEGDLPAEVRKQVTNPSAWVESTQPASRGGGDGEKKGK